MGENEYSLGEERGGEYIMRVGRWNGQGTG